MAFIKVKINSLLWLAKLQCISVVRIRFTTH